MNNVRIPDLYTQSSDEDSLAGRSSPVRDHINELSMGLLKTHANFNDDKHNNASSLTGWADVSQNKGSYQLNDIHDTHARSSVGVLYGVKNNQTNLLCLKENQEVDSNTSQSGIHGINDTQSRKSNGFLEDHPVTDHGYSPYFPSNVLPQNSVDTLPQIKSVNPASSDIDFSRGTLYGGFGDSSSSDLSKTITSFDSDLPHLHGAAKQKFESTGSDAINSL